MLSDHREAEDMLEMSSNVRLDMRSYVLMVRESRHGTQCNAHLVLGVRKAISQVSSFDSIPDSLAETVPNKNLCFGVRTCSRLVNRCRKTKSAESYEP